MNDTLKPKTPEEIVDDVISILNERNISSLNVATLNQTLTSFRFTSFTMPELKSIIELLRRQEIDPLRVMLMRRVPGITLNRVEVTQEPIIHTLRAATRSKARRAGHGGRRYTEIEEND